MNRRLTLAVAATTAMGIAAGGVVANAGAAAPKKNEIVIKGKFLFKAGHSAFDNQRFKPLDVSVKSGATVTVRNRAKTKDPHTLSFVGKQFLPKGWRRAAAGLCLGPYHLTRTP